MIAESPVQCAQLGRAFDAAGRRLRDVDVGGVFVDGEGYGGVGDGFAEEPGDALLGGRVCERMNEGSVDGEGKIPWRG